MSPFLPGQGSPCHKESSPHWVILKCGHTSNPLSSPRFCLSSSRQSSIPTLHMLGTTLFHLFIYVLSLLPCLVSYDLVRDYSGSTFFDRWDFYGSWDNLTLGVCVRSKFLVLLTFLPDRRCRVGGPRFCFPAEPGSNQPAKSCNH